MKVRGVIPLLAIAMVASGSVHPTANRHGAVTPNASPGLSSLHGVPDDSPQAVLRQTEFGQWKTTVLLTDVLPACYRLATRTTVTPYGTPLTLLSLQDDSRPTKALWDLVAQAASRTLTIPDLKTQVTQVAAAASVTSNSTTASFASASSCEVALTFARLPQVPETASLVFNDGETSFAIPLTVSRYMSLFDYLAIPAFAGFLSVLYLFLLLMLTRYLYRERLPIRRISVRASSAWTIRDSWATNITSGILVVGIILASTTATGSLFPGVTLNRFVLLDMTAGGFVLAAPAIFGILQASKLRRNRRFQLKEARTTGSPKADNVIVASLVAVLITATVTMFGIGAEIGTAIILVGLSEADSVWRLVMISGITLAALLLLWYSVTAIGALIDPEPGSTLTSPSDTSFTL